MNSTLTAEIPNYTTGAWTIDPFHSEVGFTVRHMMVTKVRGQFRTFSGQLTLAEDLALSSVNAEIDLASVDTNNDQRDDHIRSPDFLDVATYPTMTYRSTGVCANGGDYIVDGELTLHGVTREVPLKVEVNGFTPDPYGGQRVGFSATTQISRDDFGIDISMPMDGGGVVVGDKISINLEVQAVLDASV